MGAVAKPEHPPPATLNMLTGTDGSLGATWGSGATEGGELSTLGGTGWDLAPATKPSGLAKFMAGASQGHLITEEDLPVAPTLGPLEGFRQLLATEGEAKKKVDPIQKARGIEAKTLVGRMTLSFPVLRAAAHDAGLRALLLAELVSLAAEDGGAVVLPRGLRVHTVSPDQFSLFKEQLSGLNAGNLREV